MVARRNEVGLCYLRICCRDGRCKNVIIRVWNPDTGALIGVTLETSPGWQKYGELAVCLDTIEVGFNTYRQLMAQATQFNATRKDLAGLGDEILKRWRAQSRKRDQAVEDADGA